MNYVYPKMNHGYPKMNFGYPKMNFDIQKRIMDIHKYGINSKTAPCIASPRTALRVLMLQPEAQPYCFKTEHYPSL